MEAAVGLIELNSIGKGIETADAMIKVAGVELVEAHSICPGKYFVLVTGTLADVESSISRGLAMAGDMLVDHMIIPNIHPQVVPAITGTSDVDDIDALGVIETFSIASCILAADAAAKAADVRLIELRLAMALGGKAFLTLTGEVGAVKASVNAGCDTIKEEGILISRVVIPKAHTELKKTII